MALARDMELRPLTLAELRRAAKMDDMARDIACVAWSAGVLPGEVEAWFETISAGEALYVIQRVADVSGMTEEAQFRG